MIPGMSLLAISGNTSDDSMPRREIIVLDVLDVLFSFARLCGDLLRGFRIAIAIGDAMSFPSRRQRKSSSSSSDAKAINPIMLEPWQLLVLQRLLLRRSASPLYQIKNNRMFLQPVFGLLSLPWRLVTLVWTSARVEGTAHQQMVPGQYSVPLADRWRCQGDPISRVQPHASFVIEISAVIMISSCGRR